MRLDLTFPVLPHTAAGSRDTGAYIPSLDGWRAVAILLVLSHHVGTAFYNPEYYWSTSPTRFGVIGVPIFFGLSGFLITALLLQEFQKCQRISFKGFYIRRSFRILPPLFVFLAVLWLLGLIPTRMEFWSSVFFFRNYLPAAWGSLYTYHLWSLSVEEHFYLLWPLGLSLLARTRKILPATASIALAFGLWRSIDFHLHILHRLVPLLDTQMRTDLRFDSLMWGCCAGIILQNAKLRQTVGRYLTPPVFGAALLALVCCQILTIPLAAIWGAALIPILILATAIHPMWRLSLVLDWSLLRWIGKISYSLYLWQQLFLVPKWEPHPFPWAQTLPLSILLPFVCASISYFCIEQPAIRLGRKLAKKIGGGRPAKLDCAMGAVEAA